MGRVQQEKTPKMAEDAVHLQTASRHRGERPGQVLCTAGENNNTKVFIESE